jgi:hypothetical protein
VREVLRQAPDDRLGVYAAGVLEDLVRRRGAELVREIELEAGSDHRFEWALGGIWLDGANLPPEVVARVIRASGGKIRLLAAP